MELISFVLVSIAIFTFWNLITSRSSKNSKLPSGPKGLPILGHLLSLGKEPWKTMLEWKKTYGSIIYIRLGSLPTVILQDDTSLKQAFSQRSCSSRPPVEYFEKYSDGFRGMFFPPLEDAFEQRRFFLSNLRDFGLGKNTMEQKIKDEVTEFMMELEIDSNCGTQQKGDLKPIAIHRRFSCAVANAIFNIFMSKRYSREDAQYKALDHAVLNAVKSPGLIGEFAFFIPWFTWIDKALTVCLPGLWKSGLDVKDTYYNYLWKFAEEEVDRHRQTYVKDQPRDFLDAYLDKIDTTTDVTSSFHKSRNFLPVLIADVLLAALDTTNVALEWTVLHLVRNPDVQTRLYEEVTRVTGGFRSPSLSDRPNMPLVQAVIYEVFRSTPYVPFGILHYTNEEVTIKEYVLPKGTVIYSNLYGVARDPDVWEDPTAFKPERFLDEQGRFRKSDAWVPFSTGKRACPGQNQALDTMFLFITSITQKYALDSWDGVKPSAEWTPGIVCTPPEFQIKVSLRGQFNNNETNNN